MDNAVLPSAPPAAPAAVPVRIRHVDSLRAVAAGLVMWFHFDQTLAPLTGADPSLLRFLRTVPRFADMGRLAVLIFFSISGFVICRSFGGPRAGGGRRFLVKRFCRLYPAYWVSMLGGLWVWWLQGQPWTWKALAVNATMIPQILGQPRLLGVYWTLEIEVCFYALCLLLYWARGLDRGGVLLGLALFFAFLPRLVRIAGHGFGVDWRLAAGQPTFVLGLAVMCWGAAFRLVYDETGGFRRGPLVRRSTVVLALATLLLVDLSDPHTKWMLLGLMPSPRMERLTLLFALATFTLWVACLRVDNPVMTYLGVISYSLYLFHPVLKYSAQHLLLASPALHGWYVPLSVYLGVCSALTVALAAGAYRWVERPAIALGKRWTRLPAGTGREGGEKE